MKSTSKFKIVFLLSTIFILLSTSLFSQLPKLEQIRPFQRDGEKLKFEVSYLGIVGGYATMITSPLKDKNTVKFELRGNTIEWVENIFKLRIYLGSYTRYDDFQTLKYLESKQENERYYYNVQYFYPDEKYFIYSHRRNKDPLKNEKVTYDALGGISVLGAFYFGRTTDLKIGKTYQTTTFFRDQEKQIGVKVLREERVQTKFGKMNTVVVSPVMQFDGFLTGMKKMDIFLSDDEYKVPMLVELILPFGSIKATLISGHPSRKVKK